MRASRQPPDATHPFGHGQALYFYTLVVAILIFGIGGGLSTYEGILHVRNPEPMSDTTMSYVVLALAAGFEAVSWYFGLKAFLEEKRSESTWRAIRSTKDPTTFAVLLEDSAALLGIGAAATSIYLAERLQMPVLDGVGSIVIGALLCIAGLIMVRESKDLLLGESATPETIDDPPPDCRRSRGVPCRSPIDAADRAAVNHAGGPLDVQPAAVVRRSRARRRSHRGARQPEASGRAPDLHRGRGDEARHRRLYPL